MAIRLSMITVLLCVSLLLTSGVLAGKPATAGGFDEWGFNYQARLYRGEYCDYSRTSDECDLEGAELMVKWSEDWVTNHIKDEYDMDGRRCTWNQFFKLVSVPEGAALNVEEETWYIDGSPIGRAFAPTGYTELNLDWMIVQEVLNDPCAGFHGVQYLSPVNPGLGGW